MLQLVITADDLGIDPRRDEGIFQAFACGAITQASLLVGGPSAAAAARRAREVGLPMGLHLDLTEMPPSAPAVEVPTLLDARGTKRGKHGLREALARGEIALAEVVVEVRAQLAAFAQLTGAPARHVDGHQHIHVSPALAGVLAPLFAEAGVLSTRIPDEAPAFYRHDRDDTARAHGARATKAPAFYRQVRDDAAGARAVYAVHGVRSTAAFVGLDVMGAASGVRQLVLVVESKADLGSVELMCHPGRAGTLGDAFNRSAEREHELTVLCARPFAAAQGEGRVECVSFAQLWERGALC